MQSLLFSSLRLYFKLLGPFSMSVVNLNVFVNSNIDKIITYSYNWTLLFIYFEILSREDPDTKMLIKYIV